MRNFNLIVPTRFVFGKGVESETGTWAKSECHEHALVVSGGGHVVRSGLLAAVTSSLEAAGVEVTEQGGVRPNSEVTTVHEGIKLAREKQVVLVVPVGGGSVIDCSQAIAIGTRLDRDIWDVFSPESQAPFATSCPSPWSSPSRPPARSRATRASSPTTIWASRAPSRATSSAPAWPS